MEFKESTYSFAIHFHYLSCVCLDALLEKIKL